MIGLLHHHLRRGGVTRVLLTQAALLRDAGEPVCIFSGEAPAEPLPEGIELRLFPDLNYGQGAPAATVGRIRSFLRAQTDIHLWHIHNHNLGKHPAVTAALLDLAANLGLAVVVEGVEALDQITRLRHLRCRTAQGYLFGRPGPASELRPGGPLADEIRSPQVELSLS